MSYVCQTLDTAANVCTQWVLQPDNWWDYFAITQSQADSLTLGIGKILLGALVFTIVSFIIRKA